MPTNIEYMLGNGVIENAAKLEGVCREELQKIRGRYPGIIGNLKGCGLVWGVVFVKDGTKEIDPDLAHEIVRISIEKGLLFFAPVGAGSTIKVCPPLVINVVVLYFEWVQNIQSLTWDEEEVNRTLEKIIIRAFNEVWKKAEDSKATMRMGAYMTGLERISKAKKIRGVFP